MNATICRMCRRPKLTLPEQQEYGVCADCFNLPGFFKLPPSSRKLEPCRECRGRELVRAVAFERGAFGSDYVTAYAAPLSVAFRQSIKYSFWGGKASAEVTEEDVVRPVGWLELLICRACGLATWHALEPQKIPIGPEYGTELLEVEDEGGPYR